jgi:rhodanese-related sulfurtransferase
MSPSRLEEEGGAAGGDGVSRRRHRGRRWLAGWLGIVLAIPVLAGTVFFGLPPRPEAFRPIVEAAKPGVAWIDVPALRARLGGASRSPVLADVRTPAEYATSHLPGAIRVDPGSRGLPAELRSALEDQERPHPKDTGLLLVTYCTVGWRSGGLARFLGDDGGRGIEVRNLEGGILAWANAGGALVDEAGRPTNRVHPHDPLVGALFLRGGRPALP